MRLPALRSLGFVIAVAFIIYFLVIGQIASVRNVACSSARASYTAISTDIALQTQAYQINVRTGETSKAALNLATANSLRIDLSQFPACAKSLR